MLGLSVETGEGPFVEPPSRVQWVDKLIHLIRFSEFMLVLEGIDGVGKTTLLRQLRPDETDSTLKITEITLSANTSTSELLNQIITKLPDHTQQGGDDRARLQYIYSYGQALRNAGQHWVLEIDEAHHLSGPALDVLLNFMSANKGSGHPPQLLLAGTPALGALLATSNLATTQAARIHRMTLEPLSTDDSASYLQQKFPAVAKHPEKLRQKLVRESSGIPAEIDRLAVMLMHTGKVKCGRKIATTAAATASLTSPLASADDPLSVVSSGGSEALSAQATATTKAVGSAKAFPLSGLQMGLVAGVLIAITGVAAWQFMPDESADTIQLPATDDGDSRVSMRLNLNVEEPEEPPAPEQREMSKARQELEKRLAAYENRAANPSAPAATALAPPSDQPPLPVNRVITELTPDSQRIEQPVAQAVEPKVVSQSPLPAVQPAPAPAVVPPKPVVEQPAPVVVKAKPEPIAKPAPKPVVKPKPVKVAAASGVREAELLSWPAKGYTLQLQGSRAAKSALEFIRQQPDKSNFYYFTTVYKGGPWHVVVYGRYADRKAANAAIKTLPASLQRLKPWARTVSGVQADIRKKN